jgi:hypothetical protein
LEGRDSCGGQRGEMGGKMEIFNVKKFILCAKQILNY